MVWLFPVTPHLLNLKHSENNYLMYKVGILGEVKGKELISLRPHGNNGKLNVTWYTKPGVELKFWV